MNANPDDLAPVRAVDVTRVSRTGLSHVVDSAATEEPLDVRLHGRSFAVIMRTPGEDRALAAGFLFAERVIRSPADLGAIEHCRHPDRSEAHHVVDVFLAGDAASRVPALLESRRQLIANSSCGVCGRATIDELRRDVEPLAVSFTMDVAFLASLPARLRDTQAAFNETGGLHGAAVFSRRGDLLACAEDVGRHNAVDKAIGRLLLQEWDGRPREPRDVLVVSGRVAFEIVQKGWLAGIPTVVAVSAPTTLAIDLAREAGMTLIGFARGDSLNIYTHPERVAGV